MTLPGWTSPWQTTNAPPRCSLQLRQIAIDRGHDRGVGRWIEAVANCGQECLEVPPREVATERNRIRLGQLGARHAVQLGDHLADREPIGRTRFLDRADGEHGKVTIDERLVADVRGHA